MIELNQQAHQQLTGIKSMEIIAGAGHLFEEPGNLEEISTRAGEWFEKYLGNG